MNFISPVYEDRSRRAFLRALAVGMPGVVLCPGMALAARDTGERSLSFCHTHTGERLSIAYFKSGRYLADACQKLNLLLRDFRNDKVRGIDVRLLDLLSEISRSLSPEGTFEIISGYRSPETNAALHQKGRGVASQSLHMQGKAVDVRLPGVSLARLRSAALALGGGGVGYYPQSGFVHLDTGPVRQW